MGGFAGLEKELWHCNRCPFDVSADVRICGGTGTDNRVMFIAESPSTSGGTGIKKASDNFQTTSADLLFEEVRKKYGFGNCYLTDFVKCGKANGKPTIGNVQNCLSYLKRELELVQPKAIVAVGKSISVQVSPIKRKSYDFAAFIRENLTTDIPIFSTYHYSYVWRWKKIKGWDKGTNKLELIKPEFREKYEAQHKKVVKVVGNQLKNYCCT